MKGITCILIIAALLSPFPDVEGSVHGTSNSKSYFEAADDLTRKMGDSSCSEIPRPVDCEELSRRGHKVSGAYSIYPRSRHLGCESVKVYCDMDTDGGGWTVIQRRGNFQRSEDYFSKSWESYKRGFGDLQRDFWLGNQNIFAISNQRRYSVRFDLRDVNGTVGYALYDEFWIEDGSKNYTLHISDYSGNIGDSMTRHHDNQPFSTQERRNAKDCASSKRAGWWFSTQAFLDCHKVNLNGAYRMGRYNNTKQDGIEWISWKGAFESLEFTEIKIRPRDLKAKTSPAKNPSLYSARQKLAIKTPASLPAV